MKEKETNIEIWEDISNNSPKSYKSYFKAEKEYLFRNIKRNSKVLEIGCGEGRSLLELVKITKNLIGLDHEKIAIKNAINKFKDYPETKFVVGDGKNIPFANESFDYIICMLTFVNFHKDKFKILGEMKRVLKKEGEIIISAYSEDSLEERLNAYKIAKVEIKKILPNSTVVFKNLEIDNFSEQFSENELERIFKKSGLKVTNKEKTQIAYIFSLSK